MYQFVFIPLISIGGEYSRSSKRALSLGLNYGVISHSLSLVRCGTRKVWVAARIFDVLRILNFSWKKEKKKSGSHDDEPNRHHGSPHLFTSLSFTQSVILTCFQDILLLYCVWLQFEFSDGHKPKDSTTSTMGVSSTCPSNFLCPAFLPRPQSSFSLEWDKTWKQHSSTPIELHPSTNFCILYAPSLLPRLPPVKTRRTWVVTTRGHL